MAIFSIDEEEYTKEQLATFRKRQESKAKAKAFLRHNMANMQPM